MSTDKKEETTGHNDANNPDDEASSGDSTYRREIAQRAFVAELSEATHTFTESSKERAPKFALLPTGEKMNRCFLVATLLNVSHTESGMVKARLVDSSGTAESGTGRIYAYAGQYAPGPAATLEAIDPPKYVAILAKPNMFEIEGDTVFSLHPESVTVVDKTERTNWVLDAADATRDRIEQFEAGENEYAQRAADIYDTDVTPYQHGVRRAVESLKND